MFPSLRNWRSCIHLSLFARTAASDVAADSAAVDWVAAAVVVAVSLSPRMVTVDANPGVAYRIRQISKSCRHGIPK